MIIALNRAVVANEVLELARYRMAQTLSASPRAIKSEWRLGEHGLEPAFQVDTGLCDFDLAEVRTLYQQTWGEAFPEELKTREDVVVEITKQIWARYKDVLAERLDDLKSRWHGYTKEKDPGQAEG